MDFENHCLSLIKVLSEAPAPSGFEDAMRCNSAF